MSENAILPLMVKDHCKIEKLLDQLEESTKKDQSTMIKLFNKFEWELEKHIFVEEKAIFTSYNPKDISEGYKMLPELTKQHNYIVNQLNIWRKDVRNKRKINNFYEFKKFLIKHKDFEEKEVYPNLDQSLNEEQKKHIIDRINEFV